MRLEKIVTHQTLFEKMGTRGLVVAAHIAPAVTLAEGKYGEGRREVLVVGKAIEQAIRKYNRPAAVETAQN